MKHSGGKQAGVPAVQLIDERIAALGDWRGSMLAKIRALLKKTDPEIIEEWKWMGTPVWSHDGIVCTGESYKSVVKMTFAKGAFLKDPSRLFNSSLDGNVRRAIDVHEDEELNVPALTALFREAIALNSAKKAAPAKAKRTAAASSKKAAPATKKAAPAKAKKAAPATKKAAPAKAKKAATAGKKPAAPKRAGR